MTYGVWRRVSPYALSALLGAGGIGHFVVPEAYTRIIPPFLGSPGPWVYGSGVVELACAVAVAVPGTRRHGALATAALFVAVFPANLYMAYDWSDRQWWPDRVVAYARLPLQVPLVLWAYRIACKPDTARPE